MKPVSCRPGFGVAVHVRAAVLLGAFGLLTACQGDATTEPAVRAQSHSSADSIRGVATASLPVASLLAAPRVTAQGFAVIGGLYLDSDDLASVGLAIRSAQRDERCVIELGTTFLDGNPATLSASEIQTVGTLLAKRSAVLLDAIFGTTTASLANAPSQCVLVVMGNFHLPASGTQAATAVGVMIRDAVVPMLVTKSYRARVSVYVSPSLEDQARGDWSRLALATAEGLAGIDDSWAARVRFVHNPSPASGASTFYAEPASITIKAMTTATSSARSVSKNVNVGVVRMCNGTVAGCKAGAKGQRQFIMTNDGYNVYLAGKEARSTTPNGNAFATTTPQSITEFQTAVSALEASDVMFLAWHGWMNKFDQTREGGLPTYARPSATLPHRAGFALNTTVREWISSTLR